jgi:hypothetical protein
MLTKDWWAKNAGGVFLTVLIGAVVSLALLGACQYIKNTVTAELKNYMPASVWTQWAQERGEWRGKVDANIESQAKELVRMRTEIQDRLSAMDKKQEVNTVQLMGKLDTMTAMLSDMRAEFQHHINSDKKP